MYDTVLLPLAVDHETPNAVERAINLAQQYDARLVIISVVDTAVYDPLGARTGAPTEEVEERAEAQVEEVARMASEAGVESETRVSHGTPHTAILECVEEVDADAIVMATHGRRGLEHHLLGSVTERVIRLADVPVLTVPLEE